MTVCRKLNAYQVHTDPYKFMCILFEAGYMDLLPRLKLASTCISIGKTIATTYANIFLCPIKGHKPFYHLRITILKVQKYGGCGIMHPCELGGG